MRETLNTSVSGFLHPAHDRAAFDDSEEERRAFFETMWNSPGFSKLTSHYTTCCSTPRPTPSGASSSPGRSAASSSDPETAEKLIPKDHRFGEKRPPFVNGYFEAFNDPTSRSSTSRRRRSCG